MAELHQPLAFIGELVCSGQTGLLRIQQDRIVRQFQWQDGQCVGASSNARSELPGVFLEKKGHLNAAQVQTFLTEMKVPKANLWGLAGKLSGLSPEDLAKLKLEWLSLLAGTLGRLPAVTCQFQTMDTKTLLPVLLPGLRFLMDGCRALTQKELEALNPDLTEGNLVFVVDAVEKRLSPLPLDAEERGLLTVVRDNDHVSEIFSSSFIGEEKIRSLLTAFHLAGLIELKNAKAVDEEAFASQLTPEQQAQRQSLIALHQSLEKTTYYEWLGISSTSPDAEIREKGRMRLEALANSANDALFRNEERPLLEHLLTKVGEALSVLGDPLKRKDYDALVSQGKTGSVQVESSAARERDVLSAGKQKEEAGDHLGAAALYEQELKAGLDSDRIIAALAKCLIAQTQGKDVAARDKSLTWIQVALKRKSRTPEIYEALGDWMSLLEKPEKAVETYQRALVLNPWSFTAHQGLKALNPLAGGAIALSRIAQNLNQLNYYQLLGLPSKAPTKEIQAAYRQCTKYFHPDRYFQAENDDLKNQAKEVYKRMVEAYMTLKHPSKKMAYDSSGVLESGTMKSSSPSQPSALPQTPQGKKYLDLAAQAQKEGKTEAAKLNLQLGLQLEPHCEIFSEKLQALTK